MADIKSVNETVGSREATRKWQSGGISTTYTRVYLIVANDTVTNLKDLIDLAGDGTYGDTIPEMGDEFPTDSQATVHDYTVQELDGWLTFLVLVNYRQPDVGGQNSDPTENDWIVSTDFVPYEKIMTTEAIFDNDGKIIGDPILNSAGDPFDPPVSEMYSYVKINATKWFNSWDIETQAVRQGSMNSEELTAFGVVFPAHTLRCVRWTTPGKVEQGSGEYYQLQAEFIFKPVRRVQSDDGNINENGKQFKEVPGWDRPILDQGFNSLQGENNLKLPVVIGGEKERVPVKLDGNGQFNITNIQTVFLVFQTVIEQDMTTWGLPTTMP